MEEIIIKKENELNRIDSVLSNLTDMSRVTIQRLIDERKNYCKWYEYKSFI